MGRMWAGVRDYFAFEKAILKDAWQRSWTVFKPEGNIKRDLFVFGIGAGLRLKFSGEDVALDDFAAAMFYGVFALGAGLTLALIWNIFSAPYRLWKKAVEQQAELSLKLSQVQEVVVDRRNYLETGRAIKAVVDNGLQLVMLGRVVTGQQFDSWYDRAILAVSGMPEGERASFETLLTVGPRNYFADHRPLIQECVIKLRLIMQRAFEKAEK